MLSTARLTVLSGLDHTVPTIDLGGGSMQLTFYPKEKSTVDSAPSDYIVSKVKNISYSFYKPDQPPVQAFTL